MTWTHRCPKCKVDKPLSEFYNQKAGWCIACKRDSAIARSPTRRCVVCGVDLPRGQGPKKWCPEHHPTSRPRRRAGRPLGEHKREHCEDCGFEGRACQRVVRHFNKDKSDFSPGNIRTLCLNCDGLYRHGFRSNLGLDEDEQRELERFVRS